MQHGHDFSTSFAWVHSHMSLPNLMHSGDKVLRTSRLNELLMGNRAVYITSKRVLICGDGRLSKMVAKSYETPNG